MIKIMNSEQGKFKREGVFKMADMIIALILAGILMFAGGILGIEDLEEEGIIAGIEKEAAESPQADNKKEEAEKI